MSFGKIIRLIEDDNRIFDPYGDTLNWNPSNGGANKRGDTRSDTKTASPTGPRNQLDFAKIYGNHKKFVTFASWYHNSRGNWNDVLELSKKDAGVKELVDQAIQSFEQSTNPTSSGDGLYAKFGNQIEELVDKKKKEIGMGAHKYTTPDRWTDDDIFGSSSPSQGQSGSSSITNRLSNLEQSYSDLLRQFNDLKKKLA